MQSKVASVRHCKRRPGGLSNAPPQEVGNLYVGKEDTLFAGKESPGRSVSRETVSLWLSYSRNAWHAQDRMLCFCFCLV